MHLRRSVLTGRLLGFVIGLAVIVPVAVAGQLGRGLMLVPAVFAAVQILGVLVGDVIARDDARTVGVAGLEVRRVRDFLPQPLTWLVAVMAVALAGLLAWATAVASPDDLGRHGRALTYACTEGCTYGRFGPWPGSYYSLPMTVALLSVGLFAALAVWVTVRRPRNGANADIVRTDDVMRRRSVESVVASMGIATAGSLAGVGVVAGSGLAISAGNAAFALQAAGWGVLATGLASLVPLVWCVVVLLLPGARVEAGGRPVPSSGHGEAAGGTGGSAATRAWRS